MSLKAEIRKEFKGFSLNVSFESDGGSLGILGASGSGKSITLKCIAGIETPDSGYIELNGRVLYDSSRKINIRPQQRQTGYLFQNYALFPNMTVEENIACAIKGKKHEKEKTIRLLLEKFSLSELGSRYPSQLSGGQQQRTAVARILAYNPEVLLLDEPFSALDSHLRESLQTDMKNLLRDYRGDAVIVTHSREEIYKMCDTLLIIGEGRAAEKGRTHELFENPKNLLTAKLTGCKNISAAKKTGEFSVKAKDWNCSFTAAKPVPDNLTHIGIHSNSFYPSEEEKENCICAEIIEMTENPSEREVIFRSIPDEENHHIWWKHPKEYSFNEDIRYLKADAENILLLTEDAVL